MSSAVTSSCVGNESIALSSGDRENCDRESAILNKYFAMYYMEWYGIAWVDSVGPTNDRVDWYDNKWKGFVWWWVNEFDINIMIKV